MDKEKAKKELDILKHEIEERVEWMEDHMNDESEDPETLGTELVYSDKMLYVIDTLSDILKDIPEDDGTATYMHGLLGRMIRGMPLSILETMENRPKEWRQGGKSNGRQFYSNIRYNHLYAIENGGKITYHDPFRYEFYDILRTRTVHGAELPPFFTERILDEIIPIEFPYDPDTDHVKVYIELFECTLQDGHEPVKTLGLTHWMDSISDKPNRIFRFFDVKKDCITEIDWNTYATRRQIFDKTVETHNEESE